MRIRYQLFKAFFGLGLFHVRILVVLDGRFLASAFLRILLAVFNAIHFVTGMRNTLLLCEVVDLRQVVADRELELIGALDLRFAAHARSCTHE